MQEHTPGPWKVVGTDEEGYKAIGRLDYPSRYIAKVLVEPDGKTEANARLIAAAPDLLRAAIEVRDDLATDFVRAGILDDAIRKATGTEEEE